MKKFLGILLMLSCYVFTIQAQQNYYKYRVGMGVGFNSYYGDLSYKFFKQSNVELTYSAHAEFNLSKTWSLRFSGIGGSFSANDRKYEDSPNFDRALNFKTHILGGDALITLYTDNGKIFKEKAFMSPYFFAGFGAMKYDVFADLYDANGQQYFYWNDQSIRSIDENAFNAASAEILEKNGVYETGLRDLHTESTGAYPKYALYVPFGMGLKFRLSDRININLESKFNYALTDYLDDVTGSPVNPSLTNPTAQYAANPNNTITGNRGNTKNKLNDVFIYNSIAMYFNFGKRKYKIDAPFLYAPNTVSHSKNELPSKELEGEEQDLLSKNEYSFNKALQKERDSLNRAMSISIYKVENVERKQIQQLNANQLDSIEEIDAVANYTIKNELDTIKTLDKIQNNPIKTNNVGTKYTRVVILDSLNNVIDTAEIETTTIDSLATKSFKTPSDTLTKVNVPVLENERLDTNKIQIEKTKIDTVKNTNSSIITPQVIYDTVYIEKKSETLKDTVLRDLTQVAPITPAVKPLNKMDTIINVEKNAESINVPNYELPDTSLNQNKEEQVIIDLPNPEQEIPIYLIDNINEVNRVKLQMDSLQSQINEMNTRPIELKNTSNEKAEIENLKSKIDVLNDKYQDLVIKNNQTKLNNPATNNQDAYIQSKIDEAILKYDLKIQALEYENDNLSRKIDQQQIDINQQGTELNNAEIKMQEQQNDFKKVSGEQEEEIKKLQKKRLN